MEKIESIVANNVALLGICSDSNSSYLKGSAKAPAKIRGALHCGSANLSSEEGVSLTNNDRFIDLGDQKIDEGAEAILAITDLVSPILTRSAKPLILGGDHAITYPVFKAISNYHGPVNILHFDAHPDLYHEYEGNPYSHACPFCQNHGRRTC